MAVLYKITGPNGKIYVGVSKKSAAKRWARHIEESKQGRPYAFHAAIRKYGAEAFVVQTLLIADWEYVLDREPEAIRLFQALAPDGYNLCGGGRAPAIHPETRRKMALAKIGRRLPQATKDKISATMRGRSRHVAS